MKVKELIEYLKTQPQEAHVAIERGGNCNGYKINTDDIYLEKLSFVDEGTTTYGDYCEYDDLMHEDGVGGPIVDVLIFRQ